MLRLGYLHLHTHTWICNLQSKRKSPVIGRGGLLMKIIPQFSVEMQRGDHARRGRLMQLNCRVLGAEANVGELMRIAFG